MKLYTITEEDMRAIERAAQFLDSVITLDPCRTVEGRQRTIDMVRALEQVAKSALLVEKPPLSEKRRCPACGKLTRITTAGCDHCDLEHK